MKLIRTNDCPAPTGFYNVFKEQCVGKQNCTINNFTKILDLPFANPCNSGKTIFFAQIRCIQEDDVLQQKQFYAFIFVAMGIFACIGYKSTMLYRLLSNDVDFSQWDINTVTVEDYSLEYAITDEIW